MNDKAAELLEALAAKIGTTVEQLWAVLIAQAQLEVWKCVGFIALFSAVLAGTFIGWRRATKSEKRGYMDEAVFGWSVVLLIVSIMWLVVIVGGADIIIDAGLNPEYWALRQILGAVK